MFLLNERTFHSIRAQYDSPSENLLSCPTRLLPCTEQDMQVQFKRHCQCKVYFYVDNIANFYYSAAAVVQHDNNVIKILSRCRRARHRAINHRKANETRLHLQLWPFLNYTVVSICTVIHSVVIILWPPQTTDLHFPHIYDPLSNKCTAINRQVDR